MENFYIDPEKMIREHMLFMNNQVLLWHNTFRTMLGEAPKEVVEEAKSDSRFADKEWKQDPIYNFLKQFYLIHANLLEQLVETVVMEDFKTMQQIRFFTRQYINSLSPSNYIFTNPEVFRELLSTGGDSLAKGVDNLIHDFVSSPVEALKINQVSIDAFTLGEDLACTPGKVIFENELMQLIQYTPQTTEVFLTPLLIIPPFINKYYILDLDQKKSLVKWLVSQGFSVFMVSWVNPNASLAHTTFADYIHKGAIKALDTVTEVTGETSVNVAGYCVGGTLLGVTQSYLQSHHDFRIKSLTFLTTLFDFSSPGEVGNYISEQSLPLLEEYTRRKGYFDGRMLSLSFSLLRENNLYWSFYVENYLKGKDRVPFDILYWNGDSTNLPRDTFQYYVRNMYMENRLIEPGGIEVSGTPIDLQQIDTPSYCLATMNDHIVLWPAAYQSARGMSNLVDSKRVRFVLAGAGHVAGVINHAATGKYPHWVNTTLPENHEQWFAGAEKMQGSWWNDWYQWLLTYAGDRIPARNPGSNGFPAGEDAPGRYVKKRLEA